MSRLWVWVSGVFFGVLVASFALQSQAGNFPGEQPVYGRDVGMEVRLFYVAVGSDGAGKVEYVCKAFPGTTGSDDVTTSVWQVMRLTYNTDDRVSTVAFAGDNDAYNQICSSRTSLDYS